MNELIELLTNYRVLWIGGRLGGGKTALAVLIAREMIRRGIVDGVITNFPCVLPPSRGTDDGKLWNRCVIYDEAWSDLDARTSMTNNREYGAYARKLGCYWIFPSVHPIDRRLRAIECKYKYKSAFSGKRIYQARLSTTVRSEEEDVITFGVDISGAYGLYATAYIPTSDCGIAGRFSLSYKDATEDQDYEHEHTRYDQRIRTEAAAGAQASE